MKKILKISLFAILAVVLVLLTTVHLMYHSFTPGDKGIEVNKANLVYYHDTYDESRKAFLDEAKNLVEQFDQAELFSITIPSEIDKDLTIDILYLPPLQNSDKLFVLSSGVHGVEGFTGSAVQQMFLKELFAPEILTEMGILVIHSVNPYGFKYGRRATENNVDLNRGSDVDPALFEKTNPGYAVLNDMINPKGKASASSLQSKFFYLTAMSKILKASMSVTRQAIAQGQYEYPGGLFFGGQAFEPQIDSLTKVLPAYFAPYKTILEIDLHTAFGTRNVLHLLPYSIEDPDIRKKIESVFEDQHIEWGDSDDFYTISGGFADSFLAKLCENAQYLNMVFEWGTYDTQKTFGSIQSLHLMINENQGYHYGYKNEKQEQKIKSAVRELDYPGSDAWRSNTMETGRDMLSLVLKTYPEIN